MSKFVELVSTFVHFEVDFFLFFLVVFASVFCNNSVWFGVAFLLFVLIEFVTVSSSVLGNSYSSLAKNCRIRINITTYKLKNI